MPDPGCGWRAAPDPISLRWHVGWDEPLSRAWRRRSFTPSRRQRAGASAATAPRCASSTARRTWSRDYLEFDLSRARRRGRQRRRCSGASLAQRRWQRIRRCSIAPSQLSARHGVEVCRALGAGVLDALRLLARRARRSARAGRYTPDRPVRTVADRAVPGAVPAVRRGARARADVAPGLPRPLQPRADRRPRCSPAAATAGLWHAIQAISRLAHAGCSAGELTVTAFNGACSRRHRPRRSSAHGSTTQVMGAAVIAVSTTGPGRRAAASRIAYRDLDVEQLGAVYERVLDYEPAPRTHERTRARRATRARRPARSTRRARSPASSSGARWSRCVAGRTADEILHLRILDPAMGSGAFLVAACRYLAGAAEEALIREGRWQPHDVDAADRAALRREIASALPVRRRPQPDGRAARAAVAVAGHAGGRQAAVVSRPSPGRRRQPRRRDARRRAAAADAGWPARAGQRRRCRCFDDAGADAARSRDGVAVAPEARRRSRRLREPSCARRSRRWRRFRHRESPLGRWSRVLDLWCAGWFWENGRASRPRARSPRSPTASLQRPVRAARRDWPTALLEHGRAPSPARHRFLHWPLAFPEVFVDAHGRAARARRLRRGDRQPAVGHGARRQRRRRGARLAGGSRRGTSTDFVREAGIYRGREPSARQPLPAVRRAGAAAGAPGGRIGLVLPSGIASRRRRGAAAAAPLRSRRGRR